MLYSAFKRSRLWAYWCNPAFLGRFCRWKEGCWYRPGLLLPGKYWRRPESSCSLEYSSLCFWYARNFLWTGGYLFYTGVPSRLSLIHISRFVSLEAARGCTSDLCSEVMSSPRSEGRKRPWRQDAGKVVAGLSLDIELSEQNSERAPTFVTPWSY